MSQHVLGELLIKINMIFSNSTNLLGEHGTQVQPPSPPDPNNPLLPPPPLKSSAQAVVVCVVLPTGIARVRLQLSVELLCTHAQHRSLFFSGGNTPT